MTRHFIESKKHRNLKIKVVQLALFSSLGILGLSDCRGFPSEDPPWHPNLNMDIQEKYKPYGESDYFEDKRTMRPAIEGTVSYGNLKADDHFYLGMINGQPLPYFPHQVLIDEKFLQQGERLYNRMCAACHSAVGDGDGLVGRRLLVKPSDLHRADLLEKPPGYFFSVISKGVRTMEPYEHLIPTMDIWKIVAYIRVLQESQDADGAWIQRSAALWTRK